MLPTNAYQIDFPSLTESHMRYPPPISQIPASKKINTVFRTGILAVFLFLQVRNISKASSWNSLFGNDSRSCRSALTMELFADQYESLVCVSCKPLNRFEGTEPHDCGKLNFIRFCTPKDLYSIETLREIPLKLRDNFFD